MPILLVVFNLKIIITASQVFDSVCALRASIRQDFSFYERNFGFSFVCVFVCLFVCLFVNSITEKLLDGFRRNLVRGLGMVQGSCH